MHSGHHHSQTHTFASGLAMIVISSCAVSGAGVTIRNPGFEEGGTTIKEAGYVRQGNPLHGWLTDHDRECARNTAGIAFYDNGATPEGKVVGILQNRSVLRQDVGPFVTEGTYRIRLRANGRASDMGAYGHYGSLEVRLNSTPLIGPTEITAVDQPGRFTAPFHTFEAVFSTGEGLFPLELIQTDPAEGISILVDDIRIEAVDEAGAEQVIRVNRARARPLAMPIPGMDFRQTHWIWYPEETDPTKEAPPEPRFFRRTFDLANPAEATTALLIASADNRADITVNGTYCGTAPGFSQWYEMDFRPNLRAGRNVIAVEAINAGDLPNPAGFAGLVILQDAAGKPLFTCTTDAAWRASRDAPAGWRDPGFSDAAWPSAMPLGLVGCRPWGNFGLLTWLVPDDFPRFRVPGQEQHMELLRQLFWLHYPMSGPLATLWDGWMSMSSLWPFSGGEQEAEARRTRWRQALLTRRVDAEGYVSTHQHHGFGHGEGWPFPTWPQAGGMGWQFATEHLAYRMGPARDVSGWQLDGLETVDLSSSKGWALRVSSERASLTTPGFDVDSFVAPFIRLEWQADLPVDARVELAWATAEMPDFNADRSLPVALPEGPTRIGFSHAPLYRHPEWQGRLTRLRLTVHGAVGSSVRIMGLCTAVDTRHTINNPSFLQGCTEYFNWTGDLPFLRQNIGRMRTALAFAIREFRVEEHGCVYPPWVGHEGRTGFSRTPDGKKVIHYGRGIGTNYWDLLPFSGQDCLASIALYDALLRMADLEQSIALRGDWEIPLVPGEFSAARLRKLAETMRQRGQQLFWNPETGRFAACVDGDGVAHDYGYTFVNAEAVTYGFASPQQATTINDWMSGRRIVEGDTSIGEDIYHFRFGPRASTRRNVEWYSFVWSQPEGIPWGGQVQDGGAVLGFAYHDQMARLMTAGPDDAWDALRRTLDWFADIRAAGGYRPYYAVPGRGTLQGGGPPGGLGMDCEFFESVLVPQIMLYGFLGFRALPEGFALNPRLPGDWPELEVTRIHFRDTVLDIRATANDIRVKSHGAVAMTTRIALPGNWTVEGATAADPGPDGMSWTPVTLGEERSLLCRHAR